MLETANAYDTIEGELKGLIQLANQNVNIRIVIEINI